MCVPIKLHVCASINACVCLHRERGFTWSEVLLLEVYVCAGEPDCVSVVYAGGHMCVCVCMHCVERS